MSWASVPAVLALSVTVHTASCGQNGHFGLLDQTAWQRRPVRAPDHAPWSSDVVFMYMDSFGNANSGTPGSGSEIHFPCHPLPPAAR